METEFPIVIQAHYELKDTLPYEFFFTTNQIKTKNVAFLPFNYILRR